MGLTDKVWQTIVNNDLDDPLEKVVMELDSETFNTLRHEYTTIATDGLERQISVSEVDKNELEFYFGVDIELVPYSLEDGFKINREI